MCVYVCVCACVRACISYRAILLMSPLLNGRLEWLSLLGAAACGNELVWHWHMECVWWANGTERNGERRTTQGERACASLKRAHQGLCSQHCDQLRPDIILYRCARWCASKCNTHQRWQNVHKRTARIHVRLCNRHTDTHTTTSPSASPPAPASPSE